MPGTVSQPSVVTSGQSSTAISRNQTPLSPVRTESPAGGKIKVDEQYFANMGAANASRSDNLPPSQGGKYTGFGSAPPASQTREDDALPGLDELQRDPIQALSKGFGWFTSTVGKTAKTVNDGYLAPAAQRVGFLTGQMCQDLTDLVQIAETDLAAQARLTAAQVAKGAQTGARSAAENFNRFVEGNGEGGGARRQVPLDESKKDFWDSFAEVGAQRSGNIGTGSVKKAGAEPTKKDDAWADW